jgi:hypothetical protein
MTTETESEKTDTQQDQADAEAAFNAGFEGKDIPPATKPTEKAEPEKKEATAAADAATQATEAAAAATPAAQATEKQQPAGTEQQTQATAAPAAASTKEAAPTPAPSPKADDAAEWKAEARKLYGRLGQLTDEIKQLRTSKEAEGKPAAATPVELARLKAEYPDLAEVLTEDLAKTLGGLAAKGSDPKQVEDLVNQRVEARAAQLAAEMRDAAVTDAHPNWKQDLFTQDLATGQKTPTADYLAWRKTLSEDEARAFETSTNPYQVIRRLNAFYEWKTKAAETAAAATKAQAEKKQRLEQAVTPQGVPRASPPTMSDDEAMRKGFEEGFNS